MIFFEIASLLIIIWLIVLLIIKVELRKIEIGESSKYFNFYGGLILAVGSLIISYSFSINNCFSFLRMYFESLIAYFVFVLIIVFTFKNFDIFKTINKSFLEINSDISHKKTNIGKIYDYITQSNERILLNNLYLQNINLRDWYYFILATITAIIFFLISDPKNYFFLKSIIEYLPYDSLKETLNSYLSVILIFFVPTIFMYFIAFIFLKYNKSTYLEIYCEDLFFNLFIGLSYSIARIFISLLAFAIFILIFLKPQINQEQIENLYTSLTIYFNFNNISNLNSSSLGNQFTLAALYFTLAIAGFAVFSIAHKYKEQERKVYIIYSNFEKNFKIWFKANVDYVNFSMKDYNKKEKVQTFNLKISDLRTTIISKNVYNSSNFLTFFKYASSLINLSFICGIVTLFLNLNISNYFFYALIAFLILAILIKVTISKAFELSDVPKIENQFVQTIDEKSFLEMLEKTK